MANTQQSAAFDFNDRVGLVIIVEAATLSILAITSLLAYISYSAVTIRIGATRRWSTDTHIHYYFLNLMLFDLIQAIGEPSISGNYASGGCSTIAWIDAAGIYPGTVCTVQGAFKHVGNTGGSFQASLLYHLAIIWVIVALMVGIPNIVIDNFYGPTGHWCWIARNNFQRMGLQYMWMWLAAFITIVVYIFMALVVKRIIIIDGYRIRWMSPETRSNMSSDGSDPRLQRDEGAVALRMLLSHWGVTAWADTLLLLSGFFNTILYTMTRPKLLPRRRRSPSRVVLTSATGSNQHVGRINRFQNHKHSCPFDSKVEEGQLPSLGFELGEPQRSSFELRFAHPVISNVEQ
ncbi:hypothetical protein EDB19DRAFT_1658550 [Suillus lakei]|nr:hypothetical protein EDB19DRAFT_1658550 [Suillus lakei]